MTPAIDRQAFKDLLQPLCHQFRASFDVSDWTVYYEALCDISERLLRAAVVLVSRADVEFMPRPGQLRAYAEQARQTALAADPWRPCASCADMRGWVEMVDGLGDRRLARCPCAQAHRADLADGGIPPDSLTPAPLVGDRDEGQTWTDPARRGPDPLQLPPALQAHVHTLAASHALDAQLSRESLHKMRRSADLTPQTDLEGRPLPPRRGRKG